MKNCVQCASCPVSLPEEQAREVDELVKTLPSECHYKTKAMTVDYQFEPGERAEVSILSNAGVDKGGEVVLPEGLNLDTYRRSGIVLWNHNQDKPVASCSWIKLHHGEIRAKTIYPEKPAAHDGDWFTDTVWALTTCAPPVLRCKSIGFLPTVPAREASPDELELHPEWTGAAIYESTMLLEYSCVYNGANSDALVIAVNNKSIDGIVLKAMGIEAPTAAPVIEVAKPCCGQSRLQNLLKKMSKDKEECVSRKIEILRNEGYTEEQAQAIAYSMCHAKAIKRKARPEVKPIDINKIAAEAMEQVDVDRIVRQAIKLHRNRGKV